MKNLFTWLKNKLSPRKESVSPINYSFRDEAASPADFKDLLPDDRLMASLLRDKILNHWGYHNGAHVIPVPLSKGRAAKEKAEQYNLKKQFKYARALEHAEVIARLAIAAKHEVSLLGEK